MVHTNFTLVFTPKKSRVFFNCSWHHTNFTPVFTHVLTTFNTCFHHFLTQFLHVFSPLLTHVSPLYNMIFHVFPPISHQWTAVLCSIFSFEKDEIFKLFSWLATYFKHVITQTKHMWKSRVKTDVKWCFLTCLTPHLHQFLHFIYTCFWMWSVYDFYQLLAFTHCIYSSIS